MHLRRRVRNARNNHRTRDDVGWIIPEDAECTRSPDSGGPALNIIKRDDADREVRLSQRQSYLVNAMAHRDLK
ncbi:hypothetical protein MXF13_10825 [Leclercia adecarboxylata]|jgi:hypothetical protein|uniref:hypothetical protein n=1 Tax=Leclercia TaxID=83654 RepID=UPI000CCFD94F|nr:MULTISPECIES: hypothetical protein [Leclercia]NYU10006.1 hypothetical protein [Enterobacteriaceae bacterium CCUG 67584]POV35962.1 hypothetical protein C3388_01340 [Leclercia sp. LSNIH5]POW69093.1 hypothetical protein C3389_05105 [Leclercia sp. LSNIH2]HCH40331.1 hypothetical protein [Enterobacter sp.]AUU85669.1 hypothetical protein C2U54_17325 [Leclercia sp. LSNIH1]